MSEINLFKRLPKAVFPKHYTLLLTPDLKTFSFDGVLSILLEVKNETDTIILNAIDLVFKRIILKVNNGSEQIPKQTIASQENETLQLIFSETIPCGNYELYIEYTGEINNKMMGFYRTRYINQDGEIAYSAVTQFESTSARRCFPCWDEPAIKSTFDISLQVSKGLVALSNMPVKNAIDVNDLIRYDYETTPIMSTYLMAIAVGEFEYIEELSTDGVLIRVYTSPGKKEEGRFALEVATKVLPYFKEYFKVPYPLPKMDLVATIDFNFVAMENWGLLTFQENAILVDPCNTSATQRQFIALIIGHEIAHQWFGNLVTMEWWTHLWLNEGYASFVQYLCVQNLFPHFDIWTQFLNDMYIPAIEMDCLKNSHPIEVPIRCISEISEIFDDISYNKGASVIRMLHDYIGEENFKNGMNLYLTRYQYNNTITEDLWAALEETSTKPIADVMSTWTKQMGFPLVKVSSERTVDGKGITLTFIQQKFCADGSLPAEKHLWMIPICISTRSNPKEKIVNTILTSEETQIIIPDVATDEWIKVNPGTFGFYLTQYSSEMLQKLVPAIKNRALPTLDRAGMLTDLFALVQAGHTSTVELLKLLQNFEDETDYTVWATVCKITKKLGQLLAYTDCESNFINFEKKLLQKIARPLEWISNSTESHLDILLRELILERLSWLEDEEVIKEVQQQFVNHVGDGTVLPADLRSPCYVGILRSGNPNGYKFVMELYQSTDACQEKDRISNAFGAVKDEDLLREILNYSLFEDTNSPDTLSVVISVSTTRPGRDVAWQFLKKHWAEFINRFEGGLLLNRMIKYVAGNFVTQEMAEEIETFFNEHHCRGSERTIKQTIEAIHLNSAWLARDSNIIKEFLKSY